MLRKIIVTLVIILALVGLEAFGITQVVYSEGDRAGTVSKFSHRGYIFKTYEGELNVGGFSGQTGNMTPQIWQFTVYPNDATVIKNLEEAVVSGKRIKLHYNEHLYRFFWMGDTKYLVTKVEFAP